MTRILAAALLALVLAGPAAAAVCQPRDSLAAALERGYGEALRARAVSGAVLVELFVNPATTTFTILTVGADGTACIRAAGDGWTEYAAEEGRES